MPNSGTEPPSYGIQAGCDGGRSTMPVLCGEVFFGAAQSKAAPEVLVAKSYSMYGSLSPVQYGQPKLRPW